MTKRIDIGCGVMFIPDATPPDVLLNRMSEDAMFIGCFFVEEYSDCYAPEDSEIFLFLCDNKLMAGAEHDLHTHDKIWVVTLMPEEAQTRILEYAMHKKRMATAANVLEMIEHNDE